MKKLTFIKLANLWFVQLPYYPGDPTDLIMVKGADTLCEMLDTENRNTITVLVSDSEQDCPNCWHKHVLQYIGPVDNEVMYELQGLKLLVRLCEVTKYVFGDFPKTIYIY